MVCPLFQSSFREFGLTFLPPQETRTEAGPPHLAILIVAVLEKVVLTTFLIVLFPRAFFRASFSPLGVFFSRHTSNGSSSSASVPPRPLCAFRFFRRPLSRFTKRAAYLFTWPTRCFPPVFAQPGVPRLLGFLTSGSSDFVFAFPLTRPCVLPLPES